jgi:hypothetical protein
MFPALRQRVLIALGLAVSVGLGELLVRAAFGAVDGRGATLLSVAHPGWAFAALAGWTIAAGLVAMVCGSTGNPLAGPFVIAGGLLYVAGRGGSIDAWIRAVDSPAAYWPLAVEGLVWALPLIGIRLALRSGRGKLRAAVPGALCSAYCDELGPERSGAAPPAQASAALVPIALCVGAVYILQRPLFRDFAMSLVGALLVLLVVWGATIGVAAWLDRRAGRPISRSPMAPAFLGGAVILSVAAAGLCVLLRSADPGQVIGAMLLCFTLAGVLAHQMYPTAARLSLLLAPLMLGVAAYAWTGLDVSSVEQLLGRYYIDYPRAARPTLAPTVPLNPLALALPIFYASAGAAGVVLGVGWSQTIHASRHKHVAIAT